MADLFAQVLDTGTGSMLNAPNTTDMQSAIINTDSIELDKLLKRENLAASGGEARFLIGQGLASVNGVVETRKRRKLYPGDRVICLGVELQVVRTKSGSGQGDDPEHRPHSKQNN
ncbi:MAG: RNA-binding S4 domain-containing protein [Desulfobulbus sp.]|nr:RNA-binding S4 domain-containing protein [Desulfobulbus sp.]